VEKGSLQEHLLLSSMHREARIDAMRFEIIYGSAILDKTSHEAIEGFNSTLREYRELVFPKIRDRKFEKDASEMAKTLTTLKIKPLGRKSMKDF